jgi:hypothetical protein
MAAGLPLTFVVAELNTLPTLSIDTLNYLMKRRRPLLSGR